MKTALITATLLAAAPRAALADKLGDHPAIVVQRLQASQGYAYLRAKVDTDAPLVPATPSAMPPDR